MRSPVRASILPDSHYRTWLGLESRSAAGSRPSYVPSWHLGGCFGSSLNNKQWPKGQRIIVDRKRLSANRP